MVVVVFVVCFLFLRTLFMLLLLVLGFVRCSTVTGCACVLYLMSLYLIDFLEGRGARAAFLVSLSLLSLVLLRVVLSLGVFIILIVCWCSSVCFVFCCLYFFLFHAVFGVVFSLFFFFF